MAIHGFRPTSMGSAGMYTPTSYRGPLHLNAMEGTCYFEKEGEMVIPEVVHFAGEYSFCFAYPRESARLKAYFGGIPRPSLCQGRMRRHCCGKAPDVLLV